MRLLAAAFLLCMLTFAITLSAMEAYAPPLPHDCKYVEKAEYDYHEDVWKAGWECPPTGGPAGRIIGASILTVALSGISIGGFVLVSRFEIRRKELENERDREVLRRGIG